jgi:hypothetical protein
MSDYSSMTAPELAAEAARRMGWEANPTLCWYRLPLKDGGHEYRDIDSFDPANDLNHAAELGASFLAAFPDMALQVSKHGSLDKYHAYAFAEVGLALRFDHASEAAARTICILQAWEALSDATN